MGTVGGGVWKTDDAGMTWKNVSDGQMKTSSVGAIGVCEADPAVVYVGMGEHAPRGVMTSYGDGVYKSTDAGKTWQHFGLALTRHIAAVRVHPQNPDMPLWPLREPCTAHRLSGESTKLRMEAKPGRRCYS
jgi:photosystem II stability/assembly factor-like uncharacterized protein